MALEPRVCADMSSSSNWDNLFMELALNPLVQTEKRLPYTADTKLDFYCLKYYSMASKSLMKKPEAQSYVSHTTKRARYQTTDAVTGE